MTDNNTGNADPLPALARRLGRERDAILKKWRAEAAVSGEETFVETLTREEFYDNIPNFLEHFCARLRGDRPAPSAPARQHGAHRWQQGLSFAEVIHEWSLLHQILIERVGVLWASTDGAAESLPWVYGLLAQNVAQAIERSLVEYHARVRAQADTRVRDLEAVLARHEDRDSARGRGLHQASHDLRGSLQTIQTSCHLLQKQPLADKSRTLVEGLARAGESLSLLFNDLLDLARLEAGREPRRLSDFDAAELFRELVAAMQSSAEVGGLALNARGEGRLTVHSDAAKLRRIAQNLILNALTYTAAGAVEVGWRADSPTRWSFYVQDSGPGMTIAAENPLAANLEQAERGAAKTAGLPADTARGARASPGTWHSRGQHGEGVGLAIVHQLCELLDAVLEIDSESGRGTIFRVQLPLNYKNSSGSASAPGARG